MIRIEWVDSGRSALGWTMASELDVDVPTITTVGFLFKETEESLTVVQSVGDELLDNKEDELLFAITIPKVCIKARETLYGNAQH